MDVSPVNCGIIAVNEAPLDDFPYTFSVERGKDVDMEAIPDDGYRFAYWSGDFTEYENPFDNPITVDALFYSESFTAHFIAEGGEFVSNDEMVHIIVPEGTIIRDADGNLLSELDFDIEHDPPSPPSGSEIVGTSYELEPDGVTFDQPATLIWNYDPSDISSEMEEGNLFLAYYDKREDEWVTLLSEVDTQNHIITTSIEHFSTFAVIASDSTSTEQTFNTSTSTAANFSLSSLKISPSKTSTNKTISISVLVSNTGEEEGTYTVSLKIDDTVEEIREVTLAGGTTDTVTFNITKDEAGTYMADIDGLIAPFVVKETSINWFLLGPIIAGAAALITWVAIKLRRRDTISDYWKM